MSEQTENHTARSQRSSRRRRRRGAQQPQHRKQTSNTAANNTSSSTSNTKDGSARSPEGNSSNRRRRNSANKNRRPNRHAKNQRSNKQNTRRRNQFQQSKMGTRDETSAGGLVISGLAEAVDTQGNVDLSKMYVALIGRLDRRGRLLWSMPKGHVEPGEDIAATAEREVWEETGIHGEVCAQLGVIDYWFVSEGVRIHKTVHHHLLRYVDGELNDEDPEVTEVAWIPANELSEHFAYADERKLARIAAELLPELAREEHAAGRSTPR